MENVWKISFVGFGHELVNAIQSIIFSISVNNVILQISFKTNNQQTYHTPVIHKCYES